MSQYCISGGQSIRVSASASILPMNSQDLFPLKWTGWPSCSPRDSQESSPIPQFKSINSLSLSFLYSPTLTSICDYWKTITLTRKTFVDKVMSLFFNMLFRFCHSFPFKEQASFILFIYLFIYLFIFLGGGLLKLYFIF